jgi:ferredoxin
VSPKAILTRTVFEPVRDGQDLPAKVGGSEVNLEVPISTAVNLASGDYYLRVTGQPNSALRRITGFSRNRLTLEGPPGAAGPKVDIVVRLQRPFMDPARCIGCGMCEHECPVSGLRAIRVYSENESRSRPGRMLI